MAIRPSTRNASISASGLTKAKTFHLAALLRLGVILRVTDKSKVKH